jgi:hypothetical protein
MLWPARMTRDHAGVRLSSIPELRPFLCPPGPVGRIPAYVLGLECPPVRAVLFDKSVDQNWSLGWHQDGTIVIKQRIDVVDSGPRASRLAWSSRTALRPAGGYDHGARPFRSSSISNAPPLIAPGSHKRGRVRRPEIPDVVHQCGVRDQLRLSSRNKWTWRPEPSWQ